MDRLDNRSIYEYINFTGGSYYPGIVKEISLVYQLTVNPATVTKEFDSLAELKEFVSSNRGYLSGKIIVVNEYEDPPSEMDLDDFFYATPHITELDLTRFETTNARSLNNLFASCGATKIDMSGFDMSQVVQTSLMFGNTPGLTQLIVNQPVFQPMVTIPSINSITKIYVPNSLVSTYRSTKYWSFYDNKIFPYEELSSPLPGERSVSYETEDGVTVRTFESFITMNEFLPSIRTIATNTMTIVNNAFNATGDSLQAFLSNFTKVVDIDFVDFNTEGILGFTNMFWGCTALEVVDLTSFTIAPGSNVQGMFTNCHALRTVILNQDTLQTINQDIVLTPDTKVYVNDDLVEEYKLQQGLLNYTDQIFPYSDLLGPAPEEQPLTYIQSTGTQYINAAIDTKTPCVVEFAFTPVSISNYLCGIYSNSTSNYTVFMQSSKLNATIRGSSGALSMSSADYNDILDVRVSDTQISISRDSGGSQSTNLNGFGYVMNDYFGIFGYYNSWDRIATMSKIKLYYFKIYIEGILVRDFVPVILDGVCYLKDKVSSQLFGNLGTGEFIPSTDTFKIDMLNTLGIDSPNTVSEINDELKEVGIDV